MVMRFKINKWAHKYLAEILCILIVVILIDIWIGTTQRTEIETNTYKTLTNQEKSLINDSLSMKKINHIESTQNEFIKDAKDLRKLFRRK